MKGDVTGTGRVSITDAVEILRHLAGMTSILDNDPLAWEAGANNEAFNAARITGGEFPVISDAVEILRYLAGMTTMIVRLE
jgi:hypothetical protein